MAIIFLKLTSLHLISDYKDNNVCGVKSVGWSLWGHILWGQLSTSWSNATELSSPVSPGCRWPQLATDNGVRDGRSYLPSVALTLCKAVPTEHSANARRKYVCLLYWNRIRYLHIRDKSTATQGVWIFFITNEIIMKIVSALTRVCQRLFVRPSLVNNLI